MAGTGTTTQLITIKHALTTRTPCAIAVKRALLTTRVS